MFKKHFAIGLLALAVATQSCDSGNKTTAKAEIATPAAKHNTLTATEKNEGWTLLFDGKSIDKWKNFGKESISKGWVVEDGCLKSLGKGGDIGGDIVTVDEFENFELSLEWKISHGGNSGIFYGVNDNSDKYKAPYYTGPEYQLIDDIGFPGKLNEWNKAGANYAMHLPDKSKKRLQMIGGDFNVTKIVVKGNHVEHWLNGEKIVEFERWTPDWEERKAKGKWAKYPDYGTLKRGRIGLQDHGSPIWFRNIKIREL
ncbi:glycosyl hydrolase [Fulvitalea axinellae]|uniref:Glycosyl hydrolase n=1 Tax=Fulvitalea axinellae TaxID=1182444 RepID=A0AAU9CG36_9BACT|nr:glycosyl hydrolase [Fulvitalea axinellae]